MQSPNQPNVGLMINPTNKTKIPGMTCAQDMSPTPFLLFSLTQCDLSLSNLTGLVYS